MTKYLTLALFLIVVMGGGSTIGILTAPGDWYAGLIKPSFNPPNWIFAPVWTALYALIAWAGWRTWQQDRGDGRMRLWLAQLVLNFLWSPAFFGLQQVAVALVVILMMLATILLFITKSWNVDRLAAMAFLPYALWVGFASLLNAAILILN